MQIKKKVSCWRKEGTCDGDGGFTAEGQVDFEAEPDADLVGVVGHQVEDVVGDGRAHGDLLAQLPLAGGVVPVGAVGTGGGGGGGGGRRCGVAGRRCVAGGTGGGGGGGAGRSRTARLHEGDQLMRRVHVERQRFGFGFEHGLQKKNIK